MGRRLLLPLLLSTAAAAAPLDVERSELVVLVWKRGVAAALAHDHVVRATRFSGALALSEQGQLAVNVSVDAAGLVPDEAAVRARYRVGPPLSEGDAKAVEATLKGDGQLDVARFPTITFESTAGEVDPEGAGHVVGRLTLHGVAREVRAPVTVAKRAGLLEATARLRLKTSDFGVTPYSTLLGLIANRDEVELVIRLVAPNP